MATRSPRLVLIVWLLLLTVSATAPAYAGEGIWTTQTPLPLGISHIVLHPTSPTIVYAIGRVSLVTRDGGREWMLADVPTGTSQLIFDPLTPSIAYAITDTGQLFKRTATSPWQLVAANLAQPVTSLAINPDRPNQLWANSPSGLYRSDDTAITWVPVNVPATSPVATFILRRPDGQHVYAVVSGQGLFHSINSGESWMWMGNFPDREGEIWTWLADPNRPGTLYAATRNGLFRSGDHGANWEAMVLPSRDYRSSILAWSSLNGGTLFTTSGSILHRSQDGGKTWLPAIQLQGFRDVSRLVVDPGNPSLLYALATGNIFKSADAGLTWSPVLATMVGPSRNVIAVHPTETNIQFSNPVGTSTGEGMRSNDGGMTWQTMSGWPAQVRIGSLFFVPGQPGVTLATTASVLLVSRDAGQSWQRLGMPPVGVARAVATLLPGDVILVSLGNRLLRSKDGGQSWSSVPFPADTAINSFWTTANDASYVLAATTRGVYRSLDGGVTWLQAVGITQMNIRTLWSGRAPTEVFGDTDNQIVFSNDSGQTWRVVSSPLPGTTRQPRIVRDVADSSVVYGLLSDRVYVSPDYGRNWLPLGSALPFNVDRIVVDSLSPRRFWAMDTEGRNVWQYTLTAIPGTPTPAATPRPGVMPTATPVPGPSPTPTPTPRPIVERIAEGVRTTLSSAVALIGMGVLIALAAVWLFVGGTGWGPFVGYGSRGRHVSWLLDGQGKHATSLADEVRKRFEQRQIPDADFVPTVFQRKDILADSRPYFMVKKPIGTAGLASAGLYITAYGKDLYVSQVTYFRGPISKRKFLAAATMFILVVTYPMLGSGLIGQVRGAQAGGSAAMAIILGALIFLLFPVVAFSALSLLFGVLAAVKGYSEDKDLLAPLRVPPNEFDVDDIRALEEAVEKTVRECLDVVGIERQLMPPATERSTRPRVI